MGARRFVVAAGIMLGIKCSDKQAPWCYLYECLAIKALIM